MTRRSTLELPRVFRGRDAVTQGLLTPKDLRGRTVQRVVHGVYAPAAVRRSHALEVEALGLLLPGGALVTGRSAATVHGVELARWADPVEVLLHEPSHRALVRGSLVRRTTRDQPPDRAWSTVRLPAPERIAFDLVLGHDLPTAVGHLDAVARAGLLDAAAARRWAAGIHDRGIVAVRTALDLVDARAESIPESAVRVHLALAGIDVDLQVVVRDVAGPVARVDLAVRRRKVAVMYDGAWHALREQLEHDRAQLLRLTEAGWVVVHVSADLLRRPYDLVSAVRGAALRAAPR